MSTGTTSPPDGNDPAPVPTGLRVVAASTLCILLTEWFRLDLGYLGAMTTLIVMAQFPFTSFQKGVERILGRLAGVGYGLLLVPLFHETPLLLLALLAAGQLVAFYLYASSRFAYAALQAGVFVPTVAYAGLTSNPGAAFPTAFHIGMQVILGVGSAMLINWSTGAERSVHIEAGGEPLLPLRARWVSQSCMLTLTSLVTMFASLALDLPVIPAVVSALLLAMAADAHALRLKAKQRLLGVLFGGAYSFVAVLLLAQVPRLGLLLALSALGMFTATYYVRASTSSSYVGLQAGVVIPMVLVGWGGEFGTIETAVQRFIGVLVGWVVSLTVHLLWEAGKKAPEATAD